MYCSTFLLADRTSGRAYATVVHPTVVCLSSVPLCGICIVAKRCVLVTTDSLQEVVYEESISTKMNDLDLCIEAV